jgi:hypothetical protein
MDPTEQPRAAERGVRRAVANLVAKGVDLSFRGARDSIRLLELGSTSSHRMFEGSVAPALHALVQVQQDVAGSALDCLRGDRRWREAAGDAWQRLRAGLRYGALVASWGKELFGSARFSGEQVLVEDAFLRLSYLPPLSDVAAAPVALFHAGGGIPYSDRIFRLLPEANFYDRFRERGIGVYAMELKGDRHALDYAGLGLDELVDSIEHMSTVAFEHGGRRKMILEGYCGHGMQMLAYVAAKPEDAEAKFAAIATFVAPIDGTECKELSELVLLMPEPWIESSAALWRLLGGYVPGDAMRTGLDLSLRTTFHKTPLGYFVAGWSQKDLGAAKSLGDLSPTQRRDLAGAYWISPDNANRFPIPVGLSSYATALFRKGVAKDGAIPHAYRGQPLSLQAIRDRTTMPLFGFYGGRDVMVPDRTAYVLLSLLGERYHHVVHPLAGHISYVLSPRMWKPSDPRGLRPNPIDVLLAAVTG